MPFAGTGESTCAFSGLADRTSRFTSTLGACSRSKVINLVINAFHFTLGNRLRLRGGMRILFFVVGSLFSFAASAQTYPVSGVWIAKDYHLRQFTAGECFALKTFGVDALFDRSFPTVMIFSNGQRFVVQGGRAAERAIKSVKSLADGSFLIAESLGKHGSWLPWVKNQSFHLKIVDPMIIEITEGPTRTRLFKCSSGGSPL